MKIRNSAFAMGFAITAALLTVSATPSFAQESATASSSQAAQNQPFFKKKYKIEGTWSLSQRDGKSYVTFSDDFKTKNGPDLKIFLSPLSAADVTGKTALNGAINLGVLKNNKGAQEYEIPAGTNLSQFSTVLVHCEAYSILWGGGAL